MPYAGEYPHAGKKVLNRTTDETNTHSRPSIPDLIRSMSLPNGSWASATTNGMRIITQTGGTSKLQYEWLQHGDMRELQAEKTQPSPTPTATQPPKPTTTGPSPQTTPD